MVNFKGTFALKQQNLKSSMIKQMTIARLEKWLDSNISTLNKEFQDVSFCPQLDELYKQHNRNSLS